MKRFIIIIIMNINLNMYITHCENTSDTEPCFAISRLVMKQCKTAITMKLVLTPGTRPHNCAAVFPPPTRTNIRENSRSIKKIRLHIINITAVNRKKNEKLNDFIPIDYVSSFVYRYQTELR